MAVNAFLSQFDKASMVPARKFVLSRPFEEAYCGSGAGVQGFDTGLHRNPDFPIGARGQLGRDAPALATDRERDAASEVAVEYRQPRARSANGKRHAERLGHYG